ncbi:histone deacetylase family protein [Haliangium ochraceum]|uniref:Histone deacetylase n=1 Tax=Haliangium ochraceum (strain DSM 14365 / JCM 11303 / SMP-2) TaxID=502025 RepID=D0LSB5_HALO1|nr:histone deacetylase family protein [Haliangium ochraceum]ACY15614.1 Histone deacetylase [Haliangium ochraceum DSM 14365]
MLTIYSEDHHQQEGRAELSGGKLVPCYESPARADAIADRVRSLGLGPFEPPQDFDAAAIERVHDAEFVAFLRSAWSAWTAENGDVDALPLTWMAPGMRRVLPQTITGKLSYYGFDAGTPITAGTWAAARGAAEVALSAAARVHAGAGHAFALCRPPGHHAGSDFYGGYCFLNNAAIAAQWLRDQGAERVAVLDVDYHHGNGTQEIFYRRDDVLFVSLHADPRSAYPFFAGHADETGADAGAGCNLNLPLPLGCDWSLYADALDTALARVRAFSPDVLVVSFGADTYERDPISQFRLTSGDFVRMGDRIGALARPTVVVMEGGYAVYALGVNTGNFLTGLARAS